MSSTHLERKYRCWNDCQPQGCPGHTASIDYQSVSEALVLRDGRGQEFHIQTPELAAFSDMLKELAAYRAEVKL